MLIIDPLIDNPAKLNPSLMPIASLRSERSGRFGRGPCRPFSAIKKERELAPDLARFRKGGWESVSFLREDPPPPPPAASGSCALCHLQGSSSALANNLPPIN